MVNYLLNYHATFRAKASHNRTAPRYFTVAAISVGLNSALMFAFMHRLRMSWPLAQCITTACVLLFGYSVNSLWTFRVRSA